jgi:hypothetical protein
VKVRLLRYCAVIGAAVAISALADVISPINPPEDGFYSKVIYFRGIPIKSSDVVVDEALFAARDRLAMMLTTLPVVCSNLVSSHAELHIIGRNQVTSDLPEWRFDKGKPLPEYNGLTIDQRTRGMGGRISSCGEENLLKLEKDHYRGRDICIHEFSHCIYHYGMTRAERRRVQAQYKKSLAKGLWNKAYAASNDDEFFAELAMWYFGTHGDLHMTGPKPENGPEGLKAYDPDAFALMDDFFSGRTPTTLVTPDDTREYEDEDGPTGSSTAIPSGNGAGHPK